VLQNHYRQAKQPQLAPLLPSIRRPYDCRHQQQW
jgi:hypothetical protein